MIDRRGVLAGALAVPLGAATRAPPRAGPWEGVRDDGIPAFLGIRYGQAARFGAPVAPRPSRDRVQATRFGPHCPQRGKVGAGTSEDCLTLNVWTPEADARAGRPVLVYFHGGAYSTGSVVDPLTEGARLARAADAVVVTVNHRLNAFGYLSLARLDPRYPDSGNAGQLDLVLALHWVRRNIAAFGGDPARVTVFGQSGGGAKIATPQAMPVADGLFGRAITMSGRQVTVSGPLNATRRAEAFLRAAGATPATIAALPTERLVAALDADDPILGGPVYMGPVLDMRWLDRHPYWPDAHPQARRTPMILGNTRDETRAFIDPAGPKLAGLGWDNLAARLAPELRIDLAPEWIVAQYRAQFPDWSPERIFYAATTAGRSWPGQVIEADRRAEAGAPTWVYQLDFQSPTEPGRGAPHTMDIALAFGTLGAPGSFTGTGPEARALSARMIAAFARFARGLDPWPGYSLPARATMVFDTRDRMVDDPRRFERELFARSPYVQPGS